LTGESRCAIGTHDGEEEEPVQIRVAGPQIPVRRDVGRNVRAAQRAIGFAAKEEADVLLTLEGSLNG